VLAPLLSKFNVISLGGTSNAQRILPALREWDDRLRPPSVSLIDRDRRDSDAIRRLQNKGVFALTVPSLEHVFLKRDVISAACAAVGVSAIETSKFLRHVELGLQKAALKDREVETARFVWQRFSDEMYTPDKPPVPSAQTVRD
jgi:hypothetical protein